MKQINRKISSTGPSITDTEIKLVTEAVTNGWYENMNKYIDDFIEEFSRYMGIKFCIPTCHGTSALHLAMAGLDIGPGDEVIVPDLTWVASAAPITYVGATPVFADIDPINWCICPDSFKSLITPKTKAVVVVDLAGNMPYMDEILEIALDHGIKVIEDAAESIGATYKNKQAGTFGDVGCYSFNATKLIQSGQGGMVVTNDESIYEKIKLLSHHGIDKNPDSKYYWSTVIGFNYNWSNIQAALALAQFRRIEEFINKKHKIFEWYKKYLAGVDDLKLNNNQSCVRPTYWLMVAIIPEIFGKDKEQLIEEFQEYNIDMRPFFYPISSMPPYQKYFKGNSLQKQNPISYKLSQYGICLPYGTGLIEEDIKYICDALKDILFT